LKHLYNIILLTLTVGVSCLIGAGNGLVKGHISDSVTGEPLANVQVYIKSISAGDISTETGQFKITGVKQGHYKIKASMMGYDTETLKIMVVSGIETELKFTLDPIILEAEKSYVTATKMNKTIDHIGGSVYMVHESELRQSDSRNVQDILTRVPGVFTQDKFHSEQNVVTFRGVGLHTYVTRGILVLVDGISVNEAMGRSVFEGINLENAEKVEILKGPVSALYGPNGITGVINIVTKKAPEELKGSLSYTGGPYGSKRISGQVGKTLGPVGIYANALMHSIDGYLERNAFNTKKLSTRLSTANQLLGTLDATLDYSESVTDYPGALTREQFDTVATAGANKYTGSDKKLARFGLRNTRSLGERSGLVSNLYFRSRSDQGHYMDIRWGDTQLSLLGGEVQFNSSVLDERVQYVFGGTHDQETGISKTYNRDRDGIVTDLIGDGTSIYKISGVYAQTDIAIFGNLSTTIGARYDRVAYDWQDDFLPDSSNTSANTSLGALSPKFGIAYNPFEKLTIFGNWGRGFNPPEMDNLFSSDPESNPDLKPEYLTNYEIGVRGTFGYRVSYQISAFKMDFVDQVVKNEETDFYENIGDTEHKGIETSINTLVRKNIMVYLNHSYLKASFVDHPLYAGNRIVKTPENQLGVGMRLTLFDDLLVNVDYQWMDAYFMDNEELHSYDGHSLLNAKVRYNYKGYFASLSINNLLDTHYATSASARSAFNYRTREYEWKQSFYPGWPRNFNLTLGIDF